MIRKLKCWLKGHKWSAVRVYSVESKEPLYFEEVQGVKFGSNAWAWKCFKCGKWSYNWNGGTEPK